MFLCRPKQNRIVIFRLRVVVGGECECVAGENACRMRLRLPSRVLTLCVFKMATMEELANYISQTVEELQGKEIDILSGTPPASLLEKVGSLGMEPCVEERDPGRTAPERNGTDCAHPLTSPLRVSYTTQSCLEHESIERTK